jgi:hypothetical protein
MPSAGGPSRVVIVNEGDNRKIGAYTDGDSAATPTGIAIMGKTGADELFVLPLSAGGKLEVEGVVKRDIVNYTKVHKYVALGTTNETTVWDPTAGKKFVITDIHISATAAGTCTLRDGTAGTVFWIGSFAANGGMVSNLQTPIQSATADNSLTAQASAITQYILITGYEV